MDRTFQEKSHDYSILSVKTTEQWKTSLYIRFSETFSFNTLFSKLQKVKVCELEVFPFGTNSCLLYFSAIYLTRK